MGADAARDGLGAARQGARPASIAASASSAARPTPSRARSWSGFRARSRPAPRSATWRWSGGSRWARGGRADRRPLPPRGRAGASRGRSNVVVAGYAIETPRLLLNSACPQFPDGLANSSGLVGTHFMTHSGPGVWATFEEEIRWYKGPPNMAVTEHWNYTDDGKDFHGGYAFMSQGPLPRRLGAGAGDRQRGLWGMELRARDAEIQPHGRLRARRRDRAARRRTASSWPTRTTSTACASRA